MLSKEAAKTNFLVFGLTRQGFQPTIYHTWGEYANHYTTDAVIYVLPMYLSYNKTEMNIFL
jgi:hypothetical protein